MSDGFLQIADVQALARFFGLSYDELAKLVYGLSDSRKYTEFQIPKRTGGFRTIKSPCRRLKAIQRTLKDELYEIYSPRASSHGFVKGRSIVTNARLHVDHRETFVFNLDLSGYFDAIHFGRVRNLFRAEPFAFSHEVATVLAQICCFKNTLPQGAPTSPIVANMITRKLDRQLEDLARSRRATYSRYADDITFSFRCARDWLPTDIVKEADGLIGPGALLTRLIEDNGFTINHDKVRLAGKSRRMAVTGITVNEFPNVRRTYVRRIGSILYAWEKFGLDAAEDHFNQQYSTRHRPSGGPKSLPWVVRGRLAHLVNVRGDDDPVFAKLASRFNALIADADVGPPVKVSERRPDSSAAQGRAATCDVFLSHAKRNRRVAEAICSYFEERGLVCWIAPRDVPGGSDWGHSIIDGLEASRLLVLVLSTHADHSDNVKNEVERAFAKGLDIVSFCLEDLTLSKSLEYFLSRRQRVPAYPPPFDKHVPKLYAAVHRLLTG